MNGSRPSLPEPPRYVLASKALPLADKRVTTRSEPLGTSKGGPVLEPKTLAGVPPP